MIGKRCLEIYLLCGPILSVWNHIQEIIHKYDKNAQIQVVRLKTTADAKRLVGKDDSYYMSDSFVSLALLWLIISGLLIPNNCVEGLAEGLQRLERNRPKPKPKRKYAPRKFDLGKHCNMKPVIWHH